MQNVNSFIDPCIALMSRAAVGLAGALLCEVVMPLFVYAATAPVNGYFGGSLYARMGGKVWIRQMVLSAFLVPVGVCGTAFFINFIAMYYHASRAIPIGTMVSQVANSPLAALMESIVRSAMSKM